jgi:hypothetical protein
VTHPMIDRSTRQHFESWCQAFFRTQDGVDRATPVLLAVYARDPEMYEKYGWPILLRDAELLHGSCFWVEK